MSVALCRAVPCRALLAHLQVQRVSIWVLVNLDDSAHPAPNTVHSAVSGTGRCYPCMPALSVPCTLGVIQLRRWASGRWHRVLQLPVSSVSGNTCHTHRLWQWQWQATASSIGSKASPRHHPRRTPSSIPVHISAPPDVQHVDRHLLLALLAAVRGRCSCGCLLFLLCTPALLRGAMDRRPRS